MTESDAEQGHAEQGPREGCFEVEQLRCIECGTLSGRDALCWRSYRTDDPTEDEPPALAFYCPACAEREFGSLRPETRRRFYHS